MSEPTDSSRSPGPPPLTGARACTTPAASPPRRSAASETTAPAAPAASAGSPAQRWWPPGTHRAGRAALPAGKIGAKGREPGPPGPAAGPGVVVIPQGQTRRWRVCAPGKRIRRGPSEAQRRLGAMGPHVGASTSGTRAAPAWRCYSRAGQARWGPRPPSQPPRQPQHFAGVAPLCLLAKSARKAAKFRRAARPREANSARPQRRAAPTWGPRAPKSARAQAGRAPQARWGPRQPTLRIGRWRWAGLGSSPGSGWWTLRCPLQTRRRAFCEPPAPPLPETALAFATRRRRRRHRRCVQRILQLRAEHKQYRVARGDMDLCPRCADRAPCAPAAPPAERRQNRPASPAGRWPIPLPPPPAPH